MFGIGTFTFLLACALMGPKTSAILAAIAIVFLSSMIAGVYKAQLSDATLEQDLSNIEHAFNTETLLDRLPVQSDVVSYYTQTTDRDYRLLALFAGQGLHTSLTAKMPVGMSNTRQTIYVANAIAVAYNDLQINIEQKSTNVVNVLEIGSGRGFCTLMLAGLFAPSSSFQFHGVDLVKRHVDVVRRDAANHQCPNAHFHHGDATLTASFRPYASTAPFDIIFGIEALCHFDTPYHMSAFLTNAANHLAPNGRLIIIDGFRAENFTAAPPAQQLAMRLAERAFSIKRMWAMSEWVEAAYAAGLELRSMEDLTHQALPFWTLGWRFAHTVLRRTPAWVIRRLRASTYTAKSTDNLLAVATVAHAMRNRAAAVYGVLVFGKREVVEPRYHP